jgi:hypothetical protein
MTRSLLVAVAMLVSVAHAAPAERVKTTNPFKPPGDRRIIGVLQIEAPTPDVATSFETALQSKLDIKRFWLAPRNKMKERLASSTKWVEGCTVGLCLNEAKVQTGAELVILAALTGSGTSFGYAVTLVRTDNGRVLSQRAERCDVCTMAEAMNAATIAIVKLLDDVPNQLPDEAAEQGAAVDVAVSRANQRVDAQRHRVHRSAKVLTGLGLAIAAAGTAIYLAQESRPAYGLGTAGAGTGLAVAGLVMLSF